MENDPVRTRRAQIAKWNLIANRIGYLLFGVAFAFFFMTFLFGFPDFLVTIVAACLIAGSFLLAPSIVIGYAVKAAERHDREKGY